MKQNRSYCVKALSFGLAFVLVCSLLPVEVLRAQENKISKTDTGQNTEQTENVGPSEKNEDGIQETEEKREMETIEIRTAEDFLQFADQCHIDSWSENKHVVLKEDIDLSSVRTPMIPVFAGVFDGRGHTISGFQCVGSGYIAGLFRYIQKGAIVQNLELKGNVTGTNEKECIGSLCGINYGTIKKCRFHGNVSGRDTIGGIAGINESTGTIVDCEVLGRITGYYSTGGIAGKNHGMIDFCINRAGVNDNSEWVEEDDDMGVGIFFSINKSESDTELFSGIDAGGLAGYSDGIITRCTNYGTIGYEHAGYNIGGIAGRQTGVVSLCSNNGMVYGRKDVGGVVGQMEPYIEIDEAESLRNAVNKLHDLIGKTIDDMQEGKNVLKSDFDSLTMHGDAALQSGDALAGQMTEFVDSNIDQVQEAVNRIEHISDQLPDILGHVSGAGDAFGRANDGIKRLLKDLDVLGKVDGSAYDETEYDRVALLSTVGGRLRCDRTNPKEGDTVTITASPNEGYALKDTPRAMDANGKPVVLTAAGDNRYTFLMPKLNVKVSGEFMYTGEGSTGADFAGNLTTGELGDETGNYTLSGNDSLPKDENAPKDDAAQDDKDVSENGDVQKDKDASESETPNNSGSSPESGEQKQPDNPEENESPSQNQAGSETDTPAQDTKDTGSMEQIEVGGSVEQTDQQPVQVAAVQVILSSNLSGDAYYRAASDGVVTLTVVPDASYVLKGNPEVTDGNGKGLPLSKRPGSSYDYEFDTKGGTAPFRVNITFQKQNKEDTIDTARKDMEEAVQNLRTASDNVNSAVGKIRELMTNSDGTIKDWKNLSADEQKEIVNEIIRLAEALADMSEASASILSNLSTISKILSPYTSDAAKAAKKDLERVTEEVRNLIDELKSASGGIRGIVNYVNLQPDIQLKKLGDGFDVTREELHNELRGISDSLKNLSSNASSYTDVINADLRAVNDQLNVVFNLLADHLIDYSDLSMEELYEEISDEDIDTITTGRTDSCKNKGVVKGDINVGGIAGSMSIDEEDPEDSAAGSVEYKIGSRFITKCIINDSVNEGYVTSKKNGAGGIVGYMKHGIVVDCEGYGSVESTEGDYVGGICGESLTLIRRCYALCSASGGRNVGGIAGYADTLKDCCAIVDCSASIGRSGAIAGEAASYENTFEDADGEAKVCRNYYVGDDIYGIDNISYVDVAEPIAYDELLIIENLPTQFWHLKVIYRIEDEELGTQEVRFGESLANLEYPEIPEKEGYYGVWPDYSDQRMVGNLVVKGEYKENVTVVESNARAMADRTGEQERPYALVEQIFTEDTVLNAGLSDRTPPDAARGMEYVIYDVSLENSEIGDEDSFAIRIYNPYEDAVVWGCVDNQWTELESKQRGLYIQVSMKGTKESFCVVENKSYKMWLIAAGAGAVVLVLIAVHVIRVRRKKKATVKE